MSARPALKEWTVMFYLATDNPLAPGVISHLKAMKNAGYHPQVNVLAQFDPHGGSLPVHIFDVNRMEKLKNPNKVNIGFRPNDSFVRNMVVDKLWDVEGNKRIKKAVAKNVHYNAPIPSRTMARDDNNPDRSLSLFLDFCHRNYPARHYMLFVLGHGLIVAGDVFLFDEHGRVRNGKSGPHSLTLKQLGCVLDGFNRKIKHEGELELIGFHSCSMSGAEVAFELKNKANYMLAAQGPAYVGIWPYRQVLIRLFNDLGRSGFSRDDLKTNDLIDRLKQGDGPTYDYIREQFNGNGVGRLLKNHIVGEEPKERLINAVALKLDGVLRNPALFNEFEPAKRIPDGVSKLLHLHERKGLHGEYLKWLNRQLLMGGLTETERAGYTRSNIKNLLISIFNYCYFNGLDFQLAGYSCDLTLCDLRQVHKLETPVHKLATALTAGLKAASAADDPLIRDLLVLAHWESQSFYEEKYTDLYDFCFCLRRRCEKTVPSHKLSKSITDIMKACDEVMDVLRRGIPGDDDGIIVRCEPCGPAYQYAHGLSVYFPWAEPVDNETWRHEYRKFKFASATKWQRFLKRYFDATMRNPQEDENDPRDAYPLPRNLDRTMLDLLEDMSTATLFNDDGQLKVGSKDPLGPPVKSGSLDPTGSDGDCGSIKNYPTISHSRHKNRRRFKGQRVITNVFHSFQRTFPPRNRS